MDNAVRIAGATLLLAVVAAGCVASPSEAPADRTDGGSVGNDSVDVQGSEETMEHETAGTAPGLGADDGGRENETTDEWPYGELPRGGGIGDGASLDLGDRVLWLNGTECGDVKEEFGIRGCVTDPRREDVVVLDFRDAEDWYETDRMASFAAPLVLGDRLEPTDRQDEFGDAYRLMRSYLADALVREDGDVRHTQEVYVLGQGGEGGEEDDDGRYEDYEGRLYAVDVGANWTGGPTFDPDDAPTTLTIARSAARRHENMSTALRRDGEVVAENISSYTFPSPGNYTLVLRSPGGPVEEVSFRIDIDTLGDCNRTSMRVVRGDDGQLTVEGGSSLAGCPDPAD